jgi:hypothetical protein
VGDEITSIMVAGKNLEYDGLDLIELLSEEFEVALPLPCIYLGWNAVIPLAQPAYERITSILHGCSGTQVSPFAAYSCSFKAVFLRLLVLHTPSLHALQVVLSLLRAGNPVGHVCLIRDGYFEDAAQLPPALDGIAGGSARPFFYE